MDDDGLDDGQAVESAEREREGSGEGFVVVAGMCCSDVQITEWQQVQKAARAPSIDDARSTGC